MWTVTAGIIPGTIDEEYTRQWGLTSGEWSGPDGLKLLIEYRARADAYAQWLEIESSQERRVNWVRLEFIWF
jgi:hypothetical protein